MLLCAAEEISSALEGRALLCHIAAFVSTPADKVWGAPYWRAVFTSVAAAAHRLVGLVSRLQKHGLNSVELAVDHLLAHRCTPCLPFAADTACLLLKSHGLVKPPGALNKRVIYPAGTYAGHGLSRESLLSLVRGGVEYALQEVPQRLPFLAWGLNTFSSKLTPAVSALHLLPLLRLLLSQRLLEQLQCWKAPQRLPLFSCARNTFSTKLTPAVSAVAQPAVTNCTYAHRMTSFLPLACSLQDAAAILEEVNSSAEGLRDEVDEEVLGPLDLFIAGLKVRAIACNA